MSAWHAFPKVPKKTGKYIVAHRGHEVIMTYLNPSDGNWHKFARLGWQGDLDFGPTHWRLYEQINVPETLGYDRFSLRKPKKKPYVKELTWWENFKRKLICDHYFKTVGQQRFLWPTLFGEKLKVTISSHQCERCGKTKTTEHQEVMV